MWPRLVNGCHVNRLRVVFLLQKTRVKLHGFAVNLWRLLFKRPISRELRIVGPVLHFHPLPTDNLVQVKEGSFLTALHCRCLVPHLFVVGGLLCILGKICGHFSFKRTFSPLVMEIREVRNLTSYLETKVSESKGSSFIWAEAAWPLCSMRVKNNQNLWNICHSPWVRKSRLWYFLVPICQQSLLAKVFPWGMQVGVLIFIYRKGDSEQREVNLPH